jgi:hypothetical protein
VNPMIQRFLWCVGREVLRRAWWWQAPETALFRVIPVRWSRGSRGLGVALPVEPHRSSAPCTRDWPIYRAPAIRLGPQAVHQSICVLSSNARSINGR